MVRTKTDKELKNFKLSKEAVWLLREMSKTAGIDMTAVVELAIRERADHQGIKYNPMLEVEVSEKGKSDEEAS